MSERVAKEGISSSSQRTPTLKVSLPFGRVQLSWTKSAPFSAVTSPSVAMMIGR